MPDPTIELKGVQVPPFVPRPEVDVNAEQQRVITELGRFRQELVEAEVPQLAAHIGISVDGTKAKVLFHPDGLKLVPGRYLGQSNSLNQSLEARYDPHYPRISEGLREYRIMEGRLEVSTYRLAGEGEKVTAEWVRSYEPTTADEFNAALQGKVMEAQALQKERIALSPNGVTVPSVAK